MLTYASKETAIAGGWQAAYLYSRMLTYAAKETAIAA